MLQVDGLKMRTIRESAVCLERDELAAVAGCSYSTIYKMESRGHVPRKRTLRAIARALDVTPADLLHDAPECEREAEAPLVAGAA